MFLFFSFASVQQTLFIKPTLFINMYIAGLHHACQNSHKCSAIKTLNNVNDIMLTWEEIKQIDRQLITFGSHSISHQNLTKLSHNQQVNEIKKSKSVIEHKLKSSITGFFYPLGFSDNNVVKILKAAVYLRG